MNKKTKHIRKLRSFYCAVIALSFALATVASAEPVSDASARSKGGPFGLGVILGDPSGLSAKYFLSDTEALDFAVGFGIFQPEGFQFHMDYLWHPHVLTATEYFRLPWYVGVGPAVQIVADDADGKENDLGLGVRVPFGLAFALTKVPLDPFIEIVPGMQIVGDAGFRIDAAVGIRYYF